MRKWWRNQGPYELVVGMCCSPQWLQLHKQVDLILLNWKGPQKSICKSMSIATWSTMSKRWEKTKDKISQGPHSSILAWKSPWTEEPGRLQSMGLHDWACVHEGGGRWVGSNKLVELKEKKNPKTHNGWMGQQMWFKYKREHYSVIKRTEVMIQAKTWVNLKDNMLMKLARYKKTNTAWFHLIRST